MGEVYRATDERLARDVAIKVLKPSFSSDPDRLRRFELEARAAAALSHPNIVAIYDIGMHEGCPYIVSELLEGHTLRELLQDRLPLRQATEFGLQIAEGLEAAHEKHIVHRDLKPENLFITREGRVKILDFGIAKLTSLDAPENSSLENMVTQTKAGSILGTVCYMSPEQIRGKVVDHRSDIFSLGAILYEMATGKRAFAGETEADTMMAVLKEDPPEMAPGRQSMPAPFEQVILHCLEKDPENRFQSVRDLAFALGTVSLTTGKQTAIRPRRLSVWKWWPWLATGLLLIALGTFFGARCKGTTGGIVYRRITFQRGTIYSARFSPDSHSILYGAMWNGQPLELYTTVGDSPLARPLGFTAAHMVALSSGNELALVIRGVANRRIFDNGVLARAPLAGGTPREILEGVLYADWSPRGDLAVVHALNGQSQLEYPIGKVLYHTAGSISDIRFSPDGSRIAFMDHPARWDDRGTVCITDLSGNRTTLASGWASEGGLAWTPRGDEIWFTATENSATTRSLWAVNLSGHKRKILAVPGGITLQDIAPDGRALVTVDTERVVMEWTGKDSKDVRDLSWYDWSIATDISKDGQWVLFEESSEPAGPEYAVAIRKVDGSPPIRLGDGSAGNLSPDGKWALSVYTGSPQHLTLLPIGPGQARQIFLPDLEHIENNEARFMPDGKRIIVRGNVPGGPNRDFLVDLSEPKPKPRPVSKDAEFVYCPSPDGKYVIGQFGRILALFPVDGGPAVPVNLPSSYYVVQWSSDGKALYVSPENGIPLKIYRVELASKKTTFVRELSPADRAGVVSINPVVATRDASEYAYSYYQTLSYLYVITGLR